MDSPLTSAPTNLTRSSATRFLQQATFGALPGDVDHLLDVGIDAWFDEQLALESTISHHLNRGNGIGNDRSVWEGYLSGPDQLRKRLSYALSQIFVVRYTNLNSNNSASYIDLLERHCFGTYRDLLEHVTRSVSMGTYLTYRFSKKANEATGTVPDENYAREVMQLFSIGLWELNSDGTRRLDSSGDPIPTYDQDDVVGLARVFTGFAVQGVTDYSDYDLPMVTQDQHHETGEKRFLGTTIPALPTRTTNSSVGLALDSIASHANVAPFISHRLIQRLVTSNPSPAYVARVAAVFDDDGSAQHVRGNLAAVARAVLLDEEAWQSAPPETHGKLREPVLRFSILARAMGFTSTNGTWLVRNTSNKATGLAQQPYDAPSVFNFYRPGYIPPQSALGDAGLAAPEMQIADEASAVGWVNFVARFLRVPLGTTAFDVDDLLALATGASLTDAEAGALVDELGERLCPRGLSAPVREVAVRRVRGITDDAYDATSTATAHVRRRDNVHRDRLFGAVTMLAVSPDFLYER